MIYIQTQKNSEISFDFFLVEMQSSPVIFTETFDRIYLLGIISSTHLLIYIFVSGFDLRVGLWGNGK